MSGVTSQCCGLESAIRIIPLDDAGRLIRAMEEFGDRWKAIRKVLGVGSRDAVAGSKQDKPTIEIRKRPQNDEPRYLVGCNVVLTYLNTKTVRVKLLRTR